MADQGLLTIFVSLTALAVLIQTAILVGFYIVSTKLTRQAERAVATAQNLMEPVQGLVENFQMMTARTNDVGTTVKGELRQLAWFFEKARRSWQDRVNKGLDKERESVA